MNAQVEPSAPPAETPEPGVEQSSLPVGRAVRFGLIVSTILLLANAVVCGTWAFFTNTPGWLAWQAIPGAVAVAFIVTTILGFRFSNPGLRFVYGVSAAWLGVLNYAFFAAVVCWVLGGIDLIAGWPWSLTVIAEVVFGAGLAVGVYGLVNAAWIRITRVDIALAHLPESLEGRKIVLLSDLHLGHIYGPRFLRRVVTRLRSLQPEAVLISGDMFDGSPVGLDRLVSEWRGFTAPRGVYFVAGNHDEFAERSLYRNAVARTGIRVLNNEKIDVDGLQIVGVHDSEASDPAELRSILRGVQLDPQRASILLAHRPENLAVVEEAGISLQLSGHTHGGQMWPWNLLVSRIYRRFAHGLSRLGKLQVFTGYGVGTWGPPLRVGTRSEIILIRLTRAE